MKAAAAQIINIGSMMSIFGAASRGLCRSKAHRAVHRSWPALAADNIQANACCRADRYRPDQARPSGIDGLHDKVLARTPAARWGESADLPASRCFCHARVGLRHGTAIPVMADFDHGVSSRIDLFADSVENDSERLTSTSAHDYDWLILSNPGWAGLRSNEDLDASGDAG